MKRRTDIFMQSTKLLLSLGALVSICFFLIYLTKLADTSFAIFPLDSRSILLFGAALLVLFILSALIVSWTATFGWQTIQSIVREAVETNINNKLRILENESRGRLLTILGYLVAEMSIDPESLEPVNSERLTEAVIMCQQGYDFLKKIDGPVQFMALNNLIYYSCLNKEDQRRDFLLDKGRVLKLAAQENRSDNVLMTGCLAILQYSHNSQERDEARLLLSYLAGNSSSLKTRKEARIHLASFEEKHSMEGPGN